MSCVPESCEYVKNLEYTIDQRNEEIGALKAGLTDSLSIAEADLDKAEKKIEKLKAENGKIKEAISEHCKECSRKNYFACLDCRLLDFEKQGEKKDV